jgi:hypothetical protein
MSDTPETDAFSNNKFHDRAHELTELYNFTMGLERELNEANKELHQKYIEFDALFDEAEQIRIERDALKAEIEKMKKNDWEELRK